MSKIPIEIINLTKIHQHIIPEKSPGGILVVNTFRIPGYILMCEYKIMNESKGGSRIISPELIISLIAALIGLLLLVLAVDWRYFRDWVVVFLFKCVLDSLWGAAVVNRHLLEYPFRQLPQLYNVSLLFDFWIFPIFCILYNQITRKLGFRLILTYAVLFSAGITAIEYPLAIYTDLLEYHNWSWYITFITLTVTFLSSRVFIAFYRWGCEYFRDRRF
ncbi:MAG TPA: CBO0543 family protein [Bacteroidales bacterium]|nr:CBO0543 family protein [Bacteroidales bacterium]